MVLLKLSAPINCNKPSFYNRQFGIVPWLQVSMVLVAAGAWNRKPTCYNQSCNNPDWFSLREAPWLTSPNWPKHYICAHCKNKIQRCKFCNTAKYFASESLTCSCWEWSNIGIAVHLMFHRHTLTSINISQQISSFISIFSFTFDPMLHQPTLTDLAPSIFDVSSNSVMMSLIITDVVNFNCS